MVVMKPSDLRWARLSLVAVWLWTALVSAWQADGAARELLKPSAHVPPEAYPWLIWSGIVVDLLLGLLMAFRPSPMVYRSALLMTAAMTVLGTAIDPSLWLHPLGPLSKNLPIVALLWILSKEAS